MLAELVQLPLAVDWLTVTVAVNVVLTAGLFHRIVIEFVVVDEVMVPWAALPIDHAYVLPTTAGVVYVAVWLPQTTAGPVMVGTGSASTATFRVPVAVHAVLPVVVSVSVTVLLPATVHRITTEDVPWPLTMLPPVTFHVYVEPALFVTEYVMLSFVQAWLALPAGAVRVITGVVG